MFFLHTDARLAAASVCDQDVESHLEEAIRALELVHALRANESVLATWTQLDALNYHWLGYFCDCIQHRDCSLRSFSTVKNLRVCVPPRLHVHALTPFPYDSIDYIESPTIYNTESSVAAHRADYVRTRFGNAIWRETGTPGWFYRLCNTLLSERDRQKALLRLEPAGPARPDYARSGLVEREDVRNGPMGYLALRDGEQIVFW